MEIKIARALTEELIKVNLGNLRDDIFKEAIEQIEDDYENCMECGKEKTLNELAELWIEETNRNCPVYLTQKINTFEEVEDYYEMRYINIECKELWTTGNETHIAIKETDPNGISQVYLIKLKNGTIYDENGKDIIEEYIENNL